MTAFRPTLDFFEGQRLARQRTTLLVLAFGLALIAVTALVYLALVVGAAAVSPPLLNAIGQPERLVPSAWQPRLLLYSALGVAIVTGAGCAHTWSALRMGGAETVATMMGGSPVDSSSTSASEEERRLLNVVEEMAIASGLAVPRVYMLRHESGINAFAAGPSPDDAVIAVTRGAVEQLTRDELQGVVAHEFSHILNSDSRLNANLMGLVSGLMVMSVVGRFLLRGAFGRGGRRAGGLGLAVFLVGALLLVAGWVGVLSGHLVRFAVSRQREFLADSAAVQFTRNPRGLAGALRKIAGAGSTLSTPRAIEAAHFFFANGISGALSSWFSTHPPIEERIRRIDPDGVGVAGPVAGEPGTARSERPGVATSALVGLSPGDLVSRVGTVSEGQLALAPAILAGLPEAVTSAAHDAFGARALACALLLAPDRGAREVQLERGALDPADEKEVRRLGSELDGMSRDRRVAVLDLVMPSLDGLSHAQFEGLRVTLQRLAEADGRVTLFEWAVQRAIVHRIERRLSSRSAPTRFRTLDDTKVEWLELLSLVSWAGARDGAIAQRSLDAALREMGARGWKILPRDRLTAAVADRCLEALREVRPDQRARILRACAAASMGDGRVNAEEGGLLRVVASALGCPMPPIGDT